MIHWDTRPWPYIFLYLVKIFKICETMRLVYIFDYKMFHQEASVETIKTKNI